MSARPEYAIRLANNRIWEQATGYNSLRHTLTVTQAPAHQSGYDHLDCLFEESLDLQDGGDLHRNREVNDYGNSDGPGDLQEWRRHARNGYSHQRQGNVQELSAVGGDALHNGGLRWLDELQRQHIARADAKGEAMTTGLPE